MIGENKSSRTERHCKLCTYHATFAHVLGPPVLE